MFLEKVLPEMVEIPQKGWLIERAHRLGLPASEDRGSGRTLIARFIRSGDRDSILRTSQGKGQLCWNRQGVMIFPDFCRGTVAKRDAFRECKKVLHQRGMKFALQCPATLRVDTKEGSRRFDNPKVGTSLEVNYPSWPGTWSNPAPSRFVSVGIDVPVFSFSFSIHGVT